MKKASLYILVLFVSAMAFYACWEFDKPISGRPSPADYVHFQQDQWRNKDVEGIIAYYGENIVRHDPRNGETNGKQAIDSLLKVLFTEYPDFSLKLKEVKMIDNETFATYTGGGTNTEDLGDDIPATDKKISFDALIHSFWENGQITKEFVYYDRLAIMKQLGFQIEAPYFDFSESCL